MIARYIHLDSTYRNRNLYPKQGYFITLAGQNTPSTLNALTALDPVSNSYQLYPPISTTETFSGGTATLPALSAGASQKDNAYYGYYIEDMTIGESRLITGYNGTTQVATLSSPFSGAWAAADDYRIRKELPILRDSVAAATTTTVELTAGSSIDDIYNGKFIVFPSLGLSRIITDYDGGSLTVTFSPAINPAPGLGIEVEILGFSYDNSNQLFNITTQARDKQCYEIELISLILPNVLLANEGGGFITDFPYVQVQLSFINSSSKSFQNTLITNNPAANKALFIACVDDTPNATLPFVKIDGDCMVQTINFEPYGELLFAVYMPNGEIFTPALADNFSPQAPNPDLQISAVFSFKLYARPR